MNKKPDREALHRQRLAADRKSALAAYKHLPRINGYAEAFSIFAGETLHVRAARKPSRNPFWRLRRVHVKSAGIRDALTSEPVWTHIPAAPTELFAQKPANYRDEGADYTCRIAVDTRDLEPGVYECVIRDTAGNFSSGIFFNVKPRRLAECNLVCVLPSFTWQARSKLAGGSFHNSSLGPVRTVSTQRPIGEAADNGMQTALPFLRAFAEENVGYVCIDSADLHSGSVPEGRVPVMALLVRDEYWSVPMRDAVDAFLARGGVVLALAGSVCRWKIDVEGTNLTLDKKQRQLKGNQWYQFGRPEERSFVASHRFGGRPVERAGGKRLEGPGDAGAIEVIDPEHPIFRGVQLEKGDRFGGGVPLLSREIDAVPLRENGEIDRMWYDADDVQPKILATGMVVPGGMFRSACDRAGVVVEAAVGGGHVVHMGTAGWSLGLAQKNAAVKQVVLNAYRYCRGIAESGGTRRSRKQRKDAPS